MLDTVQQRPSWEVYFADMAHLVARRSSCNSAKVGAVIVKNRHIIATGYNGSLPGKANCCDIPGRCIAKERPGKKYDNCPAVHAEANAVAQAACCGLSIAEADIYVTRKPCLICAKLLAAAGIWRIFVTDGDKLTCEDAKSYVDQLMNTGDENNHDKKTC